MYDQKFLIFRGLPCFGKHVKPFIPAALADVIIKVSKTMLKKIFTIIEYTRINNKNHSIHQPVLGPRGGLWPVLLVSFYEYDYISRYNCHLTDGVGRHRSTYNLLKKTETSVEKNKVRNSTRSSGELIIIITN
jgi:hypothetical protein